MAVLSETLALDASTKTDTPLATDTSSVADLSQTSALDLFEQHPLFISVCVRDVGPSLLSFLHGLFAQSLSAHKVRLSITYLGGEVGPIRALQKIQRNLEGHVRGFDVSYMARATPDQGHAKAISGAAEPFILLASDNIILDAFALERLVETAKASPSDVALWELHQERDVNSVTLPSSLQETEYAHMTHFCALYRRDALEKIGGLEGNASSQKLDVGLAYRLRDSGYRSMQCREARFHAHDDLSPEEDDSAFEAWLSDSLIRIRYGSLRERFKSLSQMIARILLRPKDSQSLMMRTVLKEVGRRPALFLWRRLPPGLFPLCGRREELMRGTREQPHYAWLLDEEQPLVSVIVRVQGHPRGFLCECLRSIANQTYPHLEVITVEKGEGGIASRILSGPLFAGTETRAIQAEEEASLAELATLGLKGAHGRFCLVLDETEILFANHISRLVDALVQKPESPFAYAALRQIDMRVLKPHPLRYREGIGRTIASKNPKKLFQSDIETIPSCAILFRKESLDEASECPVVKDRDAKEGDVLPGIWKALSEQAYGARVKGVSAVHRHVIKQESE